MLLTSSVVGGLKVILGSFHCHVAQLVFLATPWAWPPGFDDDATSGEALKLYVQLIITHAACGIVTLFQVADQRDLILLSIVCVFA